MPNIHVAKIEKKNPGLANGVVGIDMMKLVAGDSRSLGGYIDNSVLGTDWDPECSCKAAGPDSFETANNNFSSVALIKI
jgi:hypothetical protein